MSEITSLVEMNVHERDVERFKSALAELVTTVEANEPGALGNDFYASGDGRRNRNVALGGPTYGRSSRVPSSLPMRTDTFPAGALA